MNTPILKNVGRACGNVGGALVPRPPAPHSANLRLHRRTDPGLTVFITKCVQPRKPALGIAERAIISSALRHAVQHNQILLAAFIVMPDHWHALVGLNDGCTLPKFMHSIMSFVAAKTCVRLSAKGCEWQDSYYETWIRSARQFEYVADYIVQNPVRKGLVAKPDLWDATSLRDRDLVTHPWPWEFEEEVSRSGR